MLWFKINHQSLVCFILILAPALSKSIHDKYLEKNDGVEDENVEVSIETIEDETLNTSDLDLIKEDINNIGINAENLAFDLVKEMIKVFHKKKVQENEKGSEENAIIKEHEDYSNENINYNKYGVNIATSESPMASIDSTKKLMQKKVNNSSNPYIKNAMKVGKVLSTLVNKISKRSAENPEDEMKNQAAHGMLMKISNVFKYGDEKLKNATNIGDNDNNNNNYEDALLDLSESFKQLTNNNNLVEVLINTMNEGYNKMKAYDNGNNTELSDFLTDLKENLTTIVNNNNRNSADYSNSDSSEDDLSIPTTTKSKPEDKKQSFSSTLLNDISRKIYTTLTGTGTGTGDANTTENLTNFTKTLINGVKGEFQNMFNYQSAEVEHSPILSAISKTLTELYNELEGPNVIKKEKEIQGNIRRRRQAENAGNRGIIQNENLRTNLQSNLNERRNLHEEGTNQLQDQATQQNQFRNNHQQIIFPRPEQSSRSFVDSEQQSIDDTRISNQPFKSSSNVDCKGLEERHVNALKVEVEKLQNLVEILRQQEEILNGLNEESMLMYNRTLTKHSGRIVSNHLDSQNDFEGINEMERIKENMQELIKSINKTHEIVEKSKLNELFLQSELDQQKMDITWLRAMVQELLFRNRDERRIKRPLERGHPEDINNLVGSPVVGLSDEHRMRSSDSSFTTEDHIDYVKEHRDIQKKVDDLLKKIDNAPESQEQTKRFLQYAMVLSKRLDDLEPISENLSELSSNLLSTWKNLNGGIKGIVESNRRPGFTAEQIEEHKTIEEGIAAAVHRLQTKLSEVTKLKKKFNQFFQSTDINIPTVEDEEDVNVPTQIDLQLNPNARMANETSEEISSEQEDIIEGDDNNSELSQSDEAANQTDYLFDPSHSPENHPLFSLASFNFTPAQQIEHNQMKQNISRQFQLEHTKLAEKAKIKRRLQQFLRPNGTVPENFFPQKLNFSVDPEAIPEIANIPDIKKVIDDLSNHTTQTRSAENEHFLQSRFGNRGGFTNFNSRQATGLPKLKKFVDELDITGLKNKDPKSLAKIESALIDIQKMVQKEPQTEETSEIIQTIQSRLNDIEETKIAEERQESPIMEDRLEKLQDAINTIRGGGGNTPDSSIEQSKKEVADAIHQVDEKLGELRNVRESLIRLLEKFENGDQILAFNGQNFNNNNELVKEIHSMVQKLLQHTQLTQNPMPNVPQRQFQSTPLNFPNINKDQDNFLQNEFQSRPTKSVIPEENMSNSVNQNFDASSNQFVPMSKSFNKQNPSDRQDIAKRIIAVQDSFDVFSRALNDLEHSDYMKNENNWPIMNGLKGGLSNLIGHLNVLTNQGYLNFDHTMPASGFQFNKNESPGRSFRMKRSLSEDDATAEIKNDLANILRQLHEEVLVDQSRSSSSSDSHLNPGSNQRFQHGSPNFESNSGMSGAGAGVGVGESRSSIPFAINNGYSQVPSYQEVLNKHSLALGRNSKITEKKSDLFTDIVEKFTDKIVDALPIVVKKLIAFAFGELTDIESYDYSYKNGYGENTDISTVFKNLGIFGYIPLILLKLLNALAAFIKILKKNKFFRTFLVPALIIAMIGASAIFLVWWLQPDVESITYYGNRNEYGIEGSNDKSKYYEVQNNNNGDSNSNNYNSGSNGHKINYENQYASYNGKAPSSISISTNTGAGTGTGSTGAGNSYGLYGGIQNYGTPVAPVFSAVNQQGRQTNDEYSVNNFVKYPRVNEFSNVNNKPSIDSVLSNYLSK